MVEIQSEKVRVSCTYIVASTARRNFVWRKLYTNATATIAQITVVIRGTRSRIAVAVASWWRGSELAVYYVRQTQQCQDANNN